MKEKYLQAKIIRFLEASGFIVVKVNNGGVFNPKTKKFIPPRRKGIADLLLCSPQGQFIAIEVKSAKGKPTPEQLDFIEQVKAHNGFGFIVYSFDDLKEKLCDPFPSLCG